MGFDLVQTIYGALFAGLVVNSWVFGIVCVLTYQYFRNFPQDKWGTKVLVTVLLGLQLFNVIIAAKMLYYYLVTSFGNNEALKFANWEFGLFYGVEVVVEFLVQLYNARRIQILTGHRASAAFISLVAFVSLGFGLAGTAKVLIIMDIVRIEPIGSISLVWLSMSMGSDIIITVYQVIYLHKHRTGIKKTNRIINTLILYIISTGLLTSITMVIEITTFALLGWNYAHVFISAFIGGISTISFLANLDARRSVREKETAGTAPTSLGLRFASTKSAGISVGAQRTRSHLVLAEKFAETHSHKAQQESDVVRLQNKPSNISNNAESIECEDREVSDEVV